MESSMVKLCLGWSSKLVNGLHSWVSWPQMYQKENFSLFFQSTKCLEMLNPHKFLLHSTSRHHQILQTSTSSDKTRWWDPVRVMWVWDLLKAMCPSDTISHNKFLTLVTVLKDNNRISRTALKWIENLYIRDIADKSLVRAQPRDSRVDRVVESRRVNGSNKIHNQWYLLLKVKTLNTVMNNLLLSFHLWKQDSLKVSL